MPIASMAEILGLPPRESAANRGKVPALVVSAGEAMVAFAVDALLAEQEIVVKGLGARIRRVRQPSARRLARGLHRP